jgi:hypothetical protein
LLRSLLPPPPPAAAPGLGRELVVEGLDLVGEGVLNLCTIFVVDVKVV